MKRVWCLSTCDTCRRILSELRLIEKGFEYIELKMSPIKAEDLDLIVKKTGLRYEDLFNKRALKYRGKSFGSDSEFREAILEEYTFIKRPIVEIDGEFFIGNNKKVVENIKKVLN